jgi:hypothetical protein
MRYIDLKILGAASNPETFKALEIELHQRLADGEILAGGLPAKLQRLQDEMTAAREEHGVFVDYADAIKVIVNQVPQGGIDFETMDKHQRILRTLRETEDGMLALEDVDYTYLVKLVNAHKWPVIDENLFEFRDDIKTAPSKDPRELAEAAE